MTWPTPAPLAMCCPACGDGATADPATCTGCHGEGEVRVCEGCHDEPAVGAGPYGSDCTPVPVAAPGDVRCEDGLNACAAVETDCCDRLRPSCHVTTLIDRDDTVLVTQCNDGYGCNR